MYGKSDVDLSTKIKQSKQHEWYIEGEGLSKEKKATET